VPLGTTFAFLPRKAHAGRASGALISLFIVQEKNMNVTFRRLLVAACAAVLLLPALASAQNPFRSAGEKISGEAYWPGRATGQYIQSAQNYAQEYQGYLARTPRPEPAVVQEVSKTLNGHLDEATKHLTSMKKDFADDKETVAAIENIEKDLAKAIERNKDMIKCCENEKFDKAMAMTCCTDLSKALGKIHADHTALMKKLSAKHTGKK